MPISTRTLSGDRHHARSGIRPGGPAVPEASGGRRRRRTVRRHPAPTTRLRRGLTVVRVWQPVSARAGKRAMRTRTATRERREDFYRERERGRENLEEHFREFLEELSVHCRGCWCSVTGSTRISSFCFCCKACVAGDESSEFATARQVVRQPTWGSEWAFRGDCEGPPLRGAETCILNGSKRIAESSRGTGNFTCPFLGAPRGCARRRIARKKEGGRNVCSGRTPLRKDFPRVPLGDPR